MTYSLVREAVGGMAKGRGLELFHETYESTYVSTPCWPQRERERESITVKTQVLTG